VDLLRAIGQANKILSWYENLAEDDIPPEWMWGFDDLLEEWFDDIRAARASGSTPTEQHTEVPMMENELASGRGRR
jgi:hypothetical protein